MTCTDTTSPTLRAASAPASVAAFTAPTSPCTSTDTRPAPTCSRPMIVTLAAFTIASPAANAATKPRVSTNPIAFDILLSFMQFPSPLWGGLLSFFGLCSSSIPITSASNIALPFLNQPLATEPWVRSTRSPMPAPSGSKAMIRSSLGYFFFDLDFEQRSSGQFVEPLGRPHLAGDNSRLHGLSLTISSLTSRALSRASGVTATLLPTMMRLLLRPISTTIVSVRSPLSIRCVPPLRAPLFAAGACGSPRKEKLRSPGDDRCPRIFIHPRDLAGEGIEIGIARRYSRSPPEPPQRRSPSPAAALPSTPRAPACGFPRRREMSFVPQFNSVSRRSEP